MPVAIELAERAIGLAAQRDAFRIPAWCDTQGSAQGHRVAFLQLSEKPSGAAQATRLHLPAHPAQPRFADVEEIPAVVFACLQPIGRAARPLDERFAAQRTA